MSGALTITPLYVALADLEVASGLVMLARQEHQAMDDALARLWRALVAVQNARGLSLELAQATGRPLLHVLQGGTPPRRTPDAA